MGALWPDSLEEQEKIIETMSDSSYEVRLKNLQTGNNISVPAGGEVVDLELSNQDRRVFISYGQAAGMSPSYPWIWWQPLSRAHWFEGRAHWFEKGVSPKAVLGTSVGESTTYTSMTYEELLAECKNLKSDNEYCRRELSAVYTPERLQRNSILFGFLSLGSLLLSSFFNINILHPIAGYLLFGISFVFYLMSLIMKREEKK